MQVRQQQCSGRRNPAAHPMPLIPALPGARGTWAATLAAARPPPPPPPCCLFAPTRVLQAPASSDQLDGNGTGYSEPPSCYLITYNVSKKHNLGTFSARWPLFAAAACCTAARAGLARRPTVPLPRMLCRRHAGEVRHGVQRAAAVPGGIAAVQHIWRTRLQRVCGLLPLQHTGRVLPGPEGQQGCGHSKGGAKLRGVLQAAQRRSVLELKGAACSSLKQCCALPGRPRPVRMVLQGARWWGWRS